MLFRLLALWVSLSLIAPAGWASTLLWVCSSEGVVHALVDTAAGVPDCCKTGCAHPEHGSAAEPEATDRCCAELDDGEDRQAPPELPDLPALPGSAPSPERALSARSRLLRLPTSGLWGPPPTGPPTWLLHRTLLL